MWKKITEIKKCLISQKKLIEIFLQFFFTLVLIFITFVATSAYYRNQIRNFYVYVGDIPISELNEIADPRKKFLSNEEKDSYKKFLTSNITKFFNSRKKNNRTLF